MASRARKEIDLETSHINIPLDLTVEIFKKLPVKSLLRFQCVSKQLLSIISSRRDFTDSIVARSLCHPPPDSIHFIFHHGPHVPSFLFSSTYHKDSAVSMHGTTKYSIFKYQYVRGLICFSSTESPYLTIHNPTTRQTAFLPDIECPSDEDIPDYFFGYDQVMNQYKVMCSIHSFKEHVCVYQVFTLGDPMKQWRKVQGIGNHFPRMRGGVYINGTIYYEGQAPSPTKKPQIRIMSFDFRTERFGYVNAPKEVTEFGRNPDLVNYKGKLGCICKNNVTEMWVMENTEKQEWSKMIFYLPHHPLEGLESDRVFSGVTLGGEIFMLKLRYLPNEPLDVYFYDPKQNSFRRTIIQGSSIPRSHRMYIKGVSNHVENTMRF